MCNSINLICVACLCLKYQHHRCCRHLRYLPPLPPPPVTHERCSKANGLSGSQPVTTLIPESSFDGLVHKSKPGSNSRGANPVLFTSYGLGLPDLTTDNKQYSQMSKNSEKLNQKMAIMNTIMNLVLINFLSIN